MLPADVVGVIAAFLLQTTEQQRSLMLVSNTWYRGVIEQDGMKPKPGVYWPWCALQERQPTCVTVTRLDDAEVAERLITTLPNLEHITIPVSERVTLEGLGHLNQLEHLTSLDISACSLSVNEDVSPATILEWLQPLGRQLTSLSLARFAEALIDADMEYLVNDFPCLTALDIAASFYGLTVSDDGVHIMAGGLPQLRSLNLRHHRWITDVGLEHLATGCKHLTSLHLRDFSKITNDGLQSLSKLEHLSVLSVPCCAQLSAAGIKHLTNLPHLTEVDVSGCGDVNDEAMACFGELKNLKSLNIGQCWHVSDDGFRNLAENCPMLTMLNADTTQLTDAGLRHLATHLCETLEELNITGCVGVTDAGLEHVGKLQQLEHFYIGTCRKLSAIGLTTGKHKNRRLKTFAANSTKLSKLAMRNIAANNPHLETLDVQSSEGGIADLFFAPQVIGSSLRNLTTLAIGAVSSHVGVAHLAVTCPSLTSLDLSGDSSEIDDQGLLALCCEGYFPSLRSLSLARVETITCRGFANIANLRELRMLDLSDCQCIGQPALDAIAKLPRLDVLRLKGLDIAEFDMTMFYADVSLV